MLLLNALPASDAHARGLNKAATTVTLHADKITKWAPTITEERRLILRQYMKQRL
jgi:hypothetical protein